MEVRIYATLRGIVGSPTIHLEGASEMTVDEMLQKILAKYPDLHSEFYLKNGDLHAAVHVLVNGRDARFINGMDTVVTDKDSIRIFPPVGGGR